MSNFIKLSEVKLQEEEMKEARGGDVFNPAIQDPSRYVVCYGVPNPILDDLLNNIPH